MPYRTPTPSLAAFLEKMSALSNPVILLEGTREVPPPDRATLVAMARRLAERMPNAIFRTGGARGSDEAFAEGIQSVDPRRIEYVLPQRKHRAAARDPASPAYSLDALEDTRLRLIADQTAAASPAYERLTRYFVHEKRDGAMAAKTRYLLRDTLKVSGSPETGLRPAAAGIFYVKEADPLGGGTGHTIRVCLAAGVPVFVQEQWRTWLDPQDGACHAE